MKPVEVSEGAEATAGLVESNVLRRLLAAAGLAARNVKPADKADVASRIEALAATRLRDLKLPPDIMALYNERQGARARAMTIGWTMVIGTLIVMNASFDFWIYRPPLLISVLCLQLTAAVPYLLSVVVLRDRRLAGLENLLIITLCILTLVFAGTVGILTGSADSFRENIMMAMLVPYTAVIFTQTDLKAAIWMMALSTLTLAGFAAASPLPNAAEKVQMAMVLALGMGGIVYGKRIQDIYRIRLFLLQARDELRTAEAARRNEQLSSIAYTDRLTDIPNRRYFDEIVETILASPKRALPLAVCLLDIDHFKNLNDQLGHLQGDHCLRVVAAVIRNNLRQKGDIVARFGGEEFVLLLPNTEGAVALEIVERVRQAVFSLNHPNPGTALGRVSISAGLAVATTSEAVDSLLQQADRALYRAKEGGRNQVENCPDREQATLKLTKI